MAGLPLVPSSLPHLQTGKTYTPLFTRLIKSRTEPEPSIARLPIFPVTIHSTRYGNISLLNGQARTWYFRQGGVVVTYVHLFMWCCVYSPLTVVYPPVPRLRGVRMRISILPNFKHIQNKTQSLINFIQLNREYWFHIQLIRAISKNKLRNVLNFPCVCI